MEVPSPVSGYLKKIIAQEGTAVKSGSIILALIAEDQSVLHKQDNPDKPTKEKVGESANTADDMDINEAWDKSLLGHLIESIREIPHIIINDMRRLVALITHGVKDEWGEDRPPIWVKIAWGGANLITWTIRLVVGIALIYLVTNHVLAPYFTKKAPFMESCERLKTERYCECVYDYYTDDEVVKYETLEDAKDYFDFGDQLDFFQKTAIEEIMKRAIQQCRR